MDQPNKYRAVFILVGSTVPETRYYDSQPAMDADLDRLNVKGRLSEVICADSPAQRLAQHQRTQRNDRLLMALGTLQNRVKGNANYEVSRKRWADAVYRVTNVHPTLPDAPPDAVQQAQDTLQRAAEHLQVTIAI